MADIAVCIKQVPGSTMVDIDPDTGTLARNTAYNITNPDDMHALEMALSLRERFGGGITVLTMGPSCAEDVLREAYAMGADRAVLITDPCFAGSDSYVTSKILSRSINKLGKFDIVITGVETTDGNTSNVGYQLSEFLGIPHITRIHKIDLKGREAIIERLYGHEYQKISVPLPLLLSVNRNANRVRFPGLAAINACFDRPFTVMTRADIGGKPEEYGLAGSPTVTLKTEVFSQKRGKELMEGTVDEKAEGLITKLKKHDILHY